MGVWGHKDPLIVYLIIDGEVIETTPEHPFFSNTLEQVPAAELQVGDRVWQGEAGYGLVETVAFVSQPQVMYNLTVAEAHTYFVGEGRWLVHNAKCWEVGKRSVSEVVGNTSVKPGIQNSVDKSYVERYAKLMTEPNRWNWNNMTKRGRPDPIKFVQNPDGTLVIFEGHHRFIAAQMTGTPIPWDNPNAVKIENFGAPWPSSNWQNYRWY